MWMDKPVTELTEEWGMKVCQLAASFRNCSSALTHSLQGNPSINQIYTKILHTGCSSYMTVSQRLVHLTQIYISVC